MTERKILPPNAARIAREAGPLVEHIYRTEGLSCFREEYKMGESKLVREGYLEEKLLPTGAVLVRKIVTRNLTRKEAEEAE